MKRIHMFGLCLLCLTHVLHANQFGYESHQQFIESVTSSNEIQYQEVLDRYATHLADFPNDVLALTEKCLFIESYTYAESDVLYFESLDDDLSACETQVQAWPENHPDRMLYDIRYLWGEEAQAKYQEIMLSDTSDWSETQKLRLYQWAENKQTWTAEYDTEIPHTAYIATRDPEFAQGAAAHELKQGNTDLAAEWVKLAKPENYQAQTRLVQLYADLGEHELAQNLLQEMEQEDSIDVVDYIKIRSKVEPDYVPGDVRLLGIKDRWQGDLELLDLFEYALDQSRPQLAQALYQVVQTDFWQDPFNHHKFKLYQLTDQWQWGWHDFYVLLVWIALVVICVLITFAVVGPVHYRGMYRRVHGHPTTESQTNWNLKHALFLGTVFSLVGTVLTIIYQYDAFYSMFFTDEEVPFSTASGLNAKIYLLDAAIMLLLSLLIIRHGKSMFQVGFKDLLKACLATVGLFVLFKLVFVAGMFVFKLTTLTTAFDLVQLTITDLADNYGLWAVFLTIALLTPLIEEYLFRGVLLNSFTKHISFGWANTIQAALFALVHDNPDHYIHHFLFGLLAGFLVKSQKHLYGAILFHMLNNALAVWVLVG